MSDDKEMPEEVQLLRSHAEKLIEHFDSVQIFANRVLDDGSGATLRVQYGAGNWLARLAQTRLWLLSEEAADKPRVPESAE